MSLVEMDEAYKARGGEQGWSSGKYTLEEVGNLHMMLEEFASKSRIVSTVMKPGGEDMPEGWRFKRCAGKKMGMPPLFFEKFKVKIKCFHSFSRSAKGNQNASRS